MPGLEDIPKSAIPAEHHADHPSDPEPPAVRELTQTDRINRHLLKSFLDRINTSGFQQSFQNVDNRNVEQTNSSDSFEE